MIDLAAPPNDPRHEDVIRDYVDNSLPLTISKGFANVYKHRMLRGKKERATAKFKGVDWHGDGYGVKVEYKLPGDPPVTRDGLEIAEECFDAWMTYFMNNQIEVPAA